MAKIYTLQTWIDEVLADPERYNTLTDAGVAIDTLIRIDLASNVATAGSPVNASRLNHMEAGIDGLDTQVANYLLTVYTTAGTSTAFTLTTLATTAELATDERFRVIFHTAAGVTPTLNRDGKGAKALKQYDSTGAKVACSATTITSGLRTNIVYDGTDYLVIDRLPATITDATISTSDITTNDASTTKHGFVVKATAPAANVLNVIGIANGETAYTNKALLDGTTPAAIGTAAPGTSLIAAHRDHVHAGAHTALSSIGTNTHAQVDTHIALQRWTTVIKTADESFQSDTTLSGDTELTFTMAASTKYVIRGRIWYTTPAAADFKFRFRGGTPTVFWLKAMYQAPLATSLTAAAIDIATPSTIVSILSAGAVTDPGYIEFEAKIDKDATSGSFFFDWAQNVSTASDTTVKAGSYIEYMIA